MKIGIAGYGFVGKAHHELLKDKHEIVISDPAYIEYHKRLPQDVDAIIVCVATPERPDGACEMGNVYDVLETAPPGVPILIKSTISIEGWDFLVDMFPSMKLNFSPEFLRAATAVEDLKKMKKLLIGGTTCDFWAKLFGIDTEVADPKELILAKYARNSFLALKVSFFNQMYDLCKALGVEYNAVAHYTAMDERIGYSHTAVTKERGFGGHCFPKDTAAIVRTAQREKVELSLIKEAIAYNNRIKRYT